MRPEGDLLPLANGVASPGEPEEAFSMGLTNRAEEDCSDVRACAGRWRKGVKRRNGLKSSDSWSPDSRVPAGVPGVTTAPLHVFWRRLSGFTALSYDRQFQKFIIIIFIYVNSSTSSSRGIWGSVRNRSLVRDPRATPGRV